MYRFIYDIIKVGDGDYGDFPSNNNNSDDDGNVEVEVLSESDEDDDN